jgi:hypothetical protein
MRLQMFLLLILFCIYPVSWAEKPSPPQGKPVPPQKGKVLIDANNITQQRELMQRCRQAILLCEKKIKADTARCKIELQLQKKDYEALLILGRDTKKTLLKQPTGVSIPVVVAVVTIFFVCGVAAGIGGTLIIQRSR